MTTSDSRTLPAWLPAALIAGGVLAASAWYLWPAPLEFPMDDTYIHFVYAQNLAEQGKLMFNYPGESGVGSTSILWVGLLALGYKLGISLHLAAKAMGAASLIVVGWSIFSLLRPWFQPILALVCAMLVVLSGSMLWFALSGMETVLFLALGLFALLLYRRQQWTWLGIALGLQTLARPEGLALALSIGLLEVWRQKRLPAGLLRALALTALVCGPWFIYLYLRTGHFLPTSALGKQFTNAASLRYALDQIGGVAVLAHFPSLLYVVLWIIYLLEFVLGGASLPAPHIAVPVSAGEIPYSLSIWALAGWALVLLPLIKGGLSQIRIQDWRQRQTGALPHPLLALLLWAILHNLTYMLMLPTPGTASRYGALNHILLWAALTWLVFRSVERRRFRWLCAVWLAATAGANTIYWNSVYDANIAHMEQVRIRAAHFVAGSLDAGDQCAAVDIGAVRYYAAVPVLDLAGLVDPEMESIYARQQVNEYLLAHDITCLILPDRIGSSQDGWLDLAGAMGISSSSILEMEEVQVFAIDRELWLRGYLPVMNSQATVTIYRLVNHE